MEKKLLIHAYVVFIPKVVGCMPLQEISGFNRHSHTEYFD